MSFLCFYLDGTPEQCHFQYALSMVEPLKFFAVANRLIFKQICNFMARYINEAVNWAVRPGTMRLRPHVHLTWTYMVNVIARICIVTGNSSAVERRTVDATAKQQSLGRWFKSALPDTFNCHVTLLRNVSSVSWNTFSLTLGIWQHSFILATSRIDAM